MLASWVVATDLHQFSQKNICDNPCKSVAAKTARSKNNFWRMRKFRRSFCPFAT